MTLHAKTVVIFGGSSGIGLATAQLAKAEGAQVAIVGTNGDKLSVAAKGLGDSVSTFAIDVQDEDGVEELFSQLGHVDHVLNTVGGVGGAPKLAAPMSELWAPIEVRLKGSIIVAKHAIPRIPAGGSVTFVSGAGTFKPFPGGATALASAGAVQTLAACLAVEAAPVRFNVISPGLTDTPLLRGMFPEDSDTAIQTWASSFPVPRAAHADEIASAALFLMKNRYVTGETLVIDGGWHLT